MTTRLPNPAATLPLPDPAPPAAGDRELVAALLRNDRKAAAEFVSAHIDAVHAFVRHRLSPRADLVDDLVQDVLLAALKGLAAYRGESSLKTWVLGIARHKVDDIFRQRLRQALTLDELGEGEPPAPDPSPDERIDGARARAKAQRVLSQMPEQYGLLLLWRYWEQRSTREMAEATGVTEKSVERMLARARTKFREGWLKE